MECAIAFQEACNRAAIRTATTIGVVMGPFEPGARTPQG